MRTDGPVFRFGPFELDAAHHRLTRGHERVPLPDACVSLLALFVVHAGEIVSKDLLADAGWKDVAVTDNSVAQAVSRLRRALGRQADGSPCIENVVGRGYRFVAPVRRVQPARPSVAVETLLAPYQAFVQGRAALAIGSLCGVTEESHGNIGLRSFSRSGVESHKMYEESKISEAEHFLQEVIRSAPRNPTVARFNVSAFLSAARSALQSALEEVRQKQGGQSWYDAAVNVDPVVRFLKDRRDINIHERPVPMRTHTTIGVGQGALSLSSTSPAVLIERGEHVPTAAREDRRSPRQVQQAEATLLLPRTCTTLTGR
jgi:DNA-binding winged helix-turn-helix (wHTH) protein